MATVRSTSKTRPGANEEAARAALVVDAYRLLERARLLGVIEGPVTMTDPIDAATQAAAVAGRLADEGIGRVAATVAAAQPGSAEAVGRLVAALDANPLPEREWGPLRALLGDELLGAVVGVSLSSVNRYASASRPTPDVVAGRLHAVAMVCADLRGGYNDYGIRRWFVRPRPSLEGASVLDALGPSWDPDGPSAAAMRRLAASVLSVGAT